MFLALDPATVMGWARGCPQSRALSFGQHRLPKCEDDYGQYGGAARDWLTGEIVRNGIKVVCYESPYLAANSTPVVLRKLGSLGTVIEIVCRDLGIECSEVPAQTWRARFIGCTQAPKHIKGQAARRKWIKEAAMRRCRQLGWQVRNDNEADACGVYYYLASNRFPAFAQAAARDTTPQMAPISGPLFDLRSDR